MRTGCSQGLSYWQADCDEFSMTVEFSVLSFCQQGCFCSLEGMSGGVQTDMGGCHRPLPDGVLMCYLASNEGCTLRFESVVFPGAVWSTCEVSHVVVCLCFQKPV